MSQTRITLRRCPEHGAWGALGSAPDEPYCRDCGKRLVDFASCGGCGRPVSPLTKYCPKCGQAV